MVKGFFVIIIVFLLVIIGVLAWLLFTTPAPVASNVATTTPTTTTTTTTTSGSPSEPMSSSVSVAAPLPNAKVGQTFQVSGTAPNGWYFEAVFPIQVRDSDGNILAHGQGQAQSDWTTPGPVTFTASITLDQAYHGSADLILMKDNPSGLPENDDSVTIPIVIQ